MAPCGFTRSDAGESLGATKSASVREPGREANALDRSQVLDQNGNAGQQPAVVTRHDLVLGLARRRQCKFGRYRHEGVERRLRLLDALKVSRLRQLRLDCRP
jgi:hypothetical protein